MATFNVEKYVGAAIQSILLQTYQNWELIIVDDCSHDGTAEVIRKYCKIDSRITLLINKANFGAAVSRNRAISIAVGKYIAIMDSDDVSYPDRFQQQNDYLDANPDISVVGGNADFVDGDGRYLNTSNMPVMTHHIRKIIFKKCPLLNPTVMFRRDFFINMGGYNEKLRRKEDYDLWLRGVKLYNYANINCVVLAYRTRRSQSIADMSYGLYVRCSHAHRCGLYFEGLLWAFITLGIGFIRKIGYHPRGYRRHSDRSKR
jgi:glycosyltransferase involved in cell wall biosynthesis